MAKIEQIVARKIFDSRGNPTIEVEVITKCGSSKASAPSGASIGYHEAIAFPDISVDKAIQCVKDKVATKLCGMNVTKQATIDQMLREIDGTKNFSKIGGNAAIAVSLAIAKAASRALKVPLYKYLSRTSKIAIPLPLGNIIGGGAHASGRTPDIQEFLITPINAKNIYEAINANVIVHKKTGELLQKTDPRFSGGKGDEGAWAPCIKSETALKILSEAIDQASSEIGVKFRIGLDIAASRLWKKNHYYYPREKKKLTKEKQLDFILNLIENFSIYYVEDPFEEEDFISFSKLTEAVGAKTLVVGDDLYTTNIERLKEGIKNKSTNAILIKPNQIGTLTETIQTIEFAKKNKIVPIVSHRSGETIDESIVHIAIAFNCPIIKAGVVGGERIAKLNELIRIEEEANLKTAKLPLFR